MRAHHFRLTVLVLFVLCGCTTPEAAKKRVDHNAYRIISAKQKRLRGEASDFTIEPRTDRYARHVDPETGLLAQPETLKITLATALDIAARNSREFQSAKEDLFRAAMALISQRHQFHLSPFVNIGSQARSALGTESISGDTEWGVTRLMKWGGSYALSVGLNALRITSAPTSDSLSTFLDFGISLPFLRNAGREVVTNNLIQADRDTLYALRDFERFKQVLGVRVISSYLRLLSQKRRIANEEANLQTLQEARRRNESLAEQGRLAMIQVDQARQQELAGENRLAVARQNYANSVDSFKDQLGLPIDLQLEVELEDVEEIEAQMQETIELDLRKSLIAALRARLDFRNAVDGITDAMRRIEVAKNQLKPRLDLNLNASASSENLRPLRYNFEDGSYTATLDYDLGLDRVDESVAYRRSLIDLERSLRAQESLREGIKLDVAASLRELRRTQVSYEIQKKSVILAQTRVNSTKKLLELGRAQTRDFLESQDALIRSQNDLINALIEYRIAYLGLLRDTGTLAVSPEGLDHETSIDLLQSE